MKKFILLMMAFTIVACSKTKIIKEEFKVGENNLIMISVPAKAFPKGIDNSIKAKVEKDYKIAECEVTYEVWTAVVNWATDEARGDKRYYFQNPGRRGGRLDENYKGGPNHPVTEISWRDSLVFCNALTEYINETNDKTFVPAYYSDANYTKLIRDSRDGEYSEEINKEKGSYDFPYLKEDADGFRIPTSNEWELAGKFIGDFNNNGTISEEGEFTHGVFAAGASDDVKNVEATSEVAWYIYSSDGHTHPVKQLKPTALGLYDMTGNVYEWIYDWDSEFFEQNRMFRGGSFGAQPKLATIGSVYYNGDFPWVKTYFKGLRVVKN